MKTSKHFWTDHQQGTRFLRNRLHSRFGIAILGLFAVFATTTGAALAQPRVGVILDTSTQRHK